MNEATNVKFHKETFWHKISRDMISSIVVFLVALPLCLGVAVASNTTPFSGLLAGIIGGIVVGMISGSGSSVSGPAAGLTAVVASQLLALGSFQAFLLALLIAGIIQILLGTFRLGLIAEFIPSSVIKGLLAAIGAIIIINQITMVVGFNEKVKLLHLHEMKYADVISHLNIPSAIIGIVSLVFIEVWGHIKVLKKSILPPQIIVVLFGITMYILFPIINSLYTLPANYLVQVPIINNVDEMMRTIVMPDFSRLTDKMIFISALTIAIVASLETLLNIEAVDKIDPQKRLTPPNRELIAQGAGNIVCGLLGGMPVTSVIVRSTANIQAGSRTKMSAILHGFLLLICVLTIPVWLNKIPLSSLAAILVATGYKLINPQIIKAKMKKGIIQFIPFAVTLVTIVCTDLLIGVLVGLGVSTFFILQRNLYIPIPSRIEQEGDKKVTKITLPNQVTFLNRAVLVKALHQVPRGETVIIDAGSTYFIDPDVLELIRDFKMETDPPYDVHVKLVGFDPKFGLNDEPSTG